VISGLEVENFQGFGGRQEIKLAPITLVFGPNASGKSSISRAIRLHAQTLVAHKESEYTGGLKYTGSETDVNLTSFNETVFGQHFIRPTPQTAGNSRETEQDSPNLRVAVTFKLSPSELGFEGLEGLSIDLSDGSNENNPASLLVTLILTTGQKLPLAYHFQTKRWRPEDPLSVADFFTQLELINFGETPTQGSEILQWQNARENSPLYGTYLFEGDPDEYAEDDYYWFGGFSPTSWNELLYACLRAQSFPLPAGVGISDLDSSQSDGEINLVTPAIGVWPIWLATLLHILGQEIPRFSDFDPRDKLDLSILGTLSAQKNRVSDRSDTQLLTLPETLDSFISRTGLKNVFLSPLALELYRQRAAGIAGEFNLDFHDSFDMVLGFSLAKVIFEAGYRIESKTYLQPEYLTEEVRFPFHQDRNRLFLIDKLFRSLREGGIASHLELMRHVPSLMPIEPRFRLEANRHELARNNTKINDWLGKLTGGRYQASFRYEAYHRRESFLETFVLDTRTGAEVAFDQVGTGLSQVLPVIQSAFADHSARSKGLGTVMIEQPELHLHPRMAGDLADMFIDAWRENGTQFILETHSENLLLRFQRRIREGEIPADLVKLVYVELDRTDPETNPYFERRNIMYELEMAGNGDILDPLPISFTSLRVEDLL
jgi:predicted ATPase